MFVLGLRLFAQREKPLLGSNFLMRLVEKFCVQLMQVARLLPCVWSLISAALDSYFLALCLKYFGWICELEFFVMDSCSSTV
ncbi:hypothetical protein HC248_03010 [Polaromonas vacuolata]|uniref:Uncharacterized protein n=1 Tax=Polaromonas vacuolata TaxID=37448 RepID=A0A6H2HCX1_9BURK|nr:hypothetical protein HC248_03010 [Polaromonas vacuolata]